MLWYKLTDSNQSAKDASYQARPEVGGSKVMPACRWDGSIIAIRTEAGLGGVIDKAPPLRTILSSCSGC